MADTKKYLISDKADLGECGFCLHAAELPNTVCERDLGRLYSALTGYARPVKATAMGAGPAQRDLLSVGRLIP